MLPHTWRVPKSLSGTFRVTPKIDTGPFESKIVSKVIRIRNGQLLKKSE